MSYYEAKRAISLLCAAELADEQFYFVKVNNAGKIVLCGDGEAAIGVLYDAPDAADQACQVAIGEVVMVAAGAAIAAGAQVACDATGRAATATSGEIILGVALEAAAAATELVPVLFNPRGAAA